MADSTYPPRAIKIPISKLKRQNATVMGHEHQEINMQRTESTEGSSSGSGSGNESNTSTLYTTAVLPKKMSLNSQTDKKADSIKFSPSLSPSMLSSSSYKSINLNSHLDSPDTPPRLICYTKHSQGFTWNDELFLPSYLVGRRHRKHRRWDDEDDDTMFDEEADRCPVMDIFVTDEEAKEMFP